MLVSWFTHFLGRVIVFLGQSQFTFMHCCTHTLCYSFHVPVFVGEVEISNFKPTYPVFTGQSQGEGQGQGQEGRPCCICSMALNSLMFLPS